MKPHAKAAYEELKNMGVPVLDPDLEWGGHFAISGEDEGGLDYDFDPHAEYGQSAAINDVLTKHDLFFEWVNTGVAAVYDY